jgi:hypothetical protein
MAVLSDAQRDEVIARVSAGLVQWHLREPAIVLMALHEPLAFLGGQALLAAQPFLGVFLGDTFTRDLALVFQDPQSFQQLLARLEQSAAHAPNSKL